MALEHTNCQQSISCRQILYLHSFLPVVAAVTTLRCVAGLLDALLLHAEHGSQVAGWIVACARTGSQALVSADHIVRELSEIALIISV